MSEETIKEKILSALGESAYPKTEEKLHRLCFGTKLFNRASFDDALRELLEDGLVVEVGSNDMKLYVSKSALVVPEHKPEPNYREQFGAKQLELKRQQEEKLAAEHQARKEKQEQEDKLYREAYSAWRQVKVDSWPVPKSRDTLDLAEHILQTALIANSALKQFQGNPEFAPNEYHQAKSLVETVMKMYLPILEPKDDIAWNDVKSLKAASDKWNEVNRLNEHCELQISRLAGLMATKPEYKRKSINLIVAGTRIDTTQELHEAIDQEKSKHYVTDRRFVDKETFEMSLGNNQKLTITKGTAWQHA
jgi:hypothetical protein